MFLIQQHMKKKKINHMNDKFKKTDNKIQNK